MKHLLRKIKWKYQRATKGYCDNDIWSMDYWFFNQLPKMLRELRECKHGVPCYTFPEVDTFPNGWLKDEIKNLKKWKSKNNYDDGKVSLEIVEGNMDRWWMVLSRMIWCFERANEDFKLPNPYWDEIWEEYYQKNNTNNIPEQLEEKYIRQVKRNEKFREKCKNEGMELLKTYIYDLWD